MEMKRIIGEYDEQIYANKWDKPDEMGKLLETHNLQRLNHEEIENLERSVTG